MEEQKNTQNILTKRRNLVFGLGLLILIIAVIVTAFSGGMSKDKYSGLTLTREIQIDDTTRQMLEDRVAVSQAALKAQQKASDEVRDWDWNLYESIAWDAYMLGDLVLARETYEEYFELNPINYKAWNNYGNICKWMNDVEMAEFAYLQALTISSSEEYYRDYIEIIQNNYDNRDDEVLKVLLESVETLGQTSWNMVTLAEYYLDHDDCDNAFAHYNVAKTLDPDNDALLNDIAEAREICK